MKEAQKKETIKKKLRPDKYQYIHNGAIYEKKCTHCDNGYVQNTEGGFVPMPMMCGICEGTGLQRFGIGCK